MANLSVTSTCNRSCGYCFASNTMQAAEPGTGNMSLDQLEKTLDLLQRSGIDEVPLMGGEPTIHPLFLDMVDRVRRRGLRLLVLSGGLIPRIALDRLASIPEEELSVLINVAVPGEAPEAEVRRQEQVLARLGSRVILGLNIHSPAVRLEFLLALIEKHGLAPAVRLGLTHPILEGGNDYLHPRYFEEVGRRVADFACLARSRGITLEFDCGWVPCMFPEGSLQELGITPEQVGLRCNPILDVLANGQVISCYPLEKFHRETIREDDTTASIAHRFSERLAPLRPLGIFRKCVDCDFRARGECTGGCLSTSLRRLQHNDFELALTTEESPAESPSWKGLSLPILEAAPGPASCSSSAHHHHAPAAPAPAARPAESPRALPAGSEACNRWSLPYIDQPRDFWEQVHEGYGDHIADVYFPLPGSIMGSGRPPQPDSHTEEFLRSRLPKSVLLNAVTLPRPVESLAPAVIEALKRLEGEFGVTRATVASLQLAQRVREALPHWSLTASVLMEISDPYQARMLHGICDTLVPASRIVRDLPALQQLRSAYRGKIRLLVNEACIPGCPFRTQHFHEMASGVPEPKSLCLDLLHEQKWLRLTGSWVLPQHLRFYDGIFDELKLAGRVTLQDPEKFLHVVGSYIQRRPLLPHEIGGGPSSVLEPIEISDELFAYTLTCGRRCHECTRCPDYHAEAMRARQAVRLAAVEESVSGMTVPLW